MTSDTESDSAGGHTKSRRFFFRSKDRLRDLRHVGKENEIQKFYQNPHSAANEALEWVEWAPPALPAPKKKKFEGAAIQVYQKLVENPAAGSDTHYASEIRLQSPMIREALAQDFEKQGLMYTAGVANSVHPHEALFFCREKIAEVAKNADDAITRSHCKLLCDVIEQHLSSLLDANDEYEKEQLIAYDKLWTLFPKESIFGLSLLGTFAGVRVELTKYEDTRLAIKGHGVRFDGTTYKLQEVVETVWPYTGKKKLSELLPYGLVDLSKHPELRERLRLRGIELLDYQTPRFLQFVPRLVPTAHSTYLQNEDRVVVDAYLHVKRLGLKLKDLPPMKKDANGTIKQLDAPNSQTSAMNNILTNDNKAANKLKRPTDDDIQRNKDMILSDEELLIMQMPLLSAFSLERGVWGLVVVENVLPVELKANVFNKLVFDEKKKDILRTLTRSFIDSKTGYDDFIAGKGQSFLVLLSGEPGTGKTLMVESLAEHLGRPLLRISSAISQAEMVGPVQSVAPPVPAITQPNPPAGQLNQAPSSGMTTEFESKMSWASDWNALVLFDEANFVIENRDSMKSRSSISVFLRHIEYFKGIIFLTTNVTSSINPALRSRVHIHLTFPNLSLSMRAQIWKNFVEHTSEGKPLLEDRDIERLSKWEMNGRDIKNAFNMARLWCQEREVELTVESIEDLITLVNPLVSKFEAEPEVEGRTTPTQNSAMQEIKDNLLDF